MSLVLFTKKKLSLFLILLQYQQQPITGMATFVCLFMMKYATMIHSDDRPNFYGLEHQ